MTSDSLIAVHIARDWMARQEARWNRQFAGHPVGPPLCAHTDFECDCDCDCRKGLASTDCNWPECGCGCAAACIGCRLVREEQGA